jgi:hypothetical protein
VPFSLATCITTLDESFKPEGAPARHPPLNLIVAGGGGAFAHPIHDQKKQFEVDSTVAGRGLIDKGEEFEAKFVTKKSQIITSRPSSSIRLGSGAVFSR